jgi:hypothetical protein
MKRIVILLVSVAATGLASEFSRGSDLEATA